MMEDLNLLRQVPYFSHLAEQDLRVLAQVGHEEHYARDSIIIDEGGINNSLNFLVSGQVKVYLEKISGREVTLAVLKQGDLFGEGCLTGEGRPSPKIIALEDTIIIRFEKNDFLRGISNDPIILGNILRESGLRPGHDIEKVRDIENYGEEESKLQREISIFEKRFAIELEGIKLISKKIEDFSNDTSSYIKEKSEETISWVQQRSKEAIESSESRSREVSEHAEKQAAQAIELAEKTIGKALEEAKNRNDAAISQIEGLISSTRSDTEAALKKVEVFWNNVKKGVVFLSSALAILGSVLIWLGYPEFKHMMELREKFKKNQEYIEVVKKNVQKESSEFEKKMGIFRDKFIDLSALKAMVLTIGRIRQESRLDRDAIDRYRSSYIAYSENRKNLLAYITASNYDEYRPEVIVEALNNFLKLIYYSDDKINDDEKYYILSTCRWSLARIKGQDFRYRVKNRDNLILFGQILRKRASDFYGAQFIPSLNSILEGDDFDEETKFTVAEALAALGEGSQNCINILAKVMKNEKISFWRRNNAAVSLSYLQDPSGRDYLFSEMAPYREHRLMAALALGEAMARNDAIKLDEAGRQKLFNCIEEGISHTTNHFQKDYAEAVLKALKEKEKLLSSK
jgi:CRP/FNR family transcriptional regulator, cyclic AMP receptor protein